jgi:hypothetical protein
MPATIVPISDHNVNASPEEVFAWADRSGDRGVLNPTTARLKVTALKRILTVLSDDEQLGAEEILNTLDQLVTRLARKEGGNPDTLQTYRQRAESLLRDYIDYQRDPLGFQARNAERPAKSERSAKTDRKTERKKEPAPAATSDVPSTPDPEGRRYVYPLGNGREFEYVLPRGGLTMREVKKIALLLISLAQDYDPPGDSVADLTRRVRPLELLEDADDDSRADDE